MIIELLAGADITETGVLADLLVILASAAIVAMVLQRVRMAVIPAYLITGAIIGPHALALVPSPEGLGVVSHLAIILLLFGIGLELHLPTLRSGMTSMLAAGLGSCLLSIVVGWPVAVWLGLSVPEALAVSMALSLSSTAVVLRLLGERRELRRAHGRMALTILLLQDMIVLAMLASLPALAKWASGSQASSVGNGSEDAINGWLWFVVDASARVAGVILLVMLGRWVLPRLLRESVRARSLEVMMTAGVAAALAAAFGTLAIGFGLEMGAFIAGFILARTPVRHQLSGQIGPLRDLFIAVFFATLGMRLDPVTVVEWWPAIVAGVAVLLVMKAILISGACWVTGAAAGVAVVVGFSLAQAGEFGLIFLGAAYDQGILADETVAIVIAVVVVSLVLTPTMVGVGHRLGRLVSFAGPAPWFKTGYSKGPTSDQDLPREMKHVVLAGYGPIGKRIAEELDVAGIHFTVVELNPMTVHEQSRQGRSFVFGDIGNIEVLESAGIGHADAVVLTIPDEEAVMRACAVVRRHLPSVFIAARTRVVSMKEDLARMGADHVAVDEAAAAQEMLEVVMRSISGDSLEADSSEE